MLYDVQRKGEHMLIALVGKAYTGKTAIATELRDQHGYTVLSFTDYLKELVAWAVNSVRWYRASDVLTVAEIVADKARYRRLIQEFGSAIGFGTDPAWIESYLEENLPPVDIRGEGGKRIFDPNIVVDCLRSPAQIEGARKFKARIVGVSATNTNRVMFAARALELKGMALKAVQQADDHPIDGALNVEEMGCDHLLFNSLDRSVAAMVDDLLGQIGFVEAL